MRLLDIITMTVLGLAIVGLVTSLTLWSSQDDEKRYTPVEVVVQ